MLKILRIDASQRRTGSASRAVTDALIKKLTSGAPAEIDRLDLAETEIQPVDETWIAARMVAPDEQTQQQRAILAASDALVDRLQAADILVIGSPVYNFGVPAALKAWVDMIARPRLTFRYTESGPEGLVKGKKAFLVMASGGTQIGAAGDFASPYLRHALGFVGVDDVTVIAAPKAGGDAGAVDEALATIEAVAV